jgi:DNA invertase Pin-like site-specific DNA recombinase
MTVYGYARVSTDGQSLTSQDAELHAAGCAKVYAEKIAALAAADRSLPRCSSASTRAMC